MKRPGDKAMGKRIKEVYLYESKSNPDAPPYETLWYTDGTYSCNCRGWVFNKKCWHIEGAKEIGEFRIPSVMPRAAAVQAFGKMMRRDAVKREDAPKVTLVLERGKRFIRLED